MTEAQVVRAIAVAMGLFVAMGLSSVAPSSAATPAASTADASTTPPSVAVDGGAGRQCRDSDFADCTEQCDRGHVDSCSDLGVLYENGQGTPKDAAKALRLYVRACDGNSGVGCRNLGLVYEFGQGVSIDLSKASQLYTRGCDAGDGTACGNAGTLFEDGDALPKDVPRAMGFFQRGCDKDDGRSCARVASHVSLGTGVPMDARRGRELWEKSCRLGEEGSCEVVRLLAAGHTVRGERDQSPSEAAPAPLTPAALALRSSGCFSVASSIAQATDFSRRLSQLKAPPPKSGATLQRIATKLPSMKRAFCFQRKAYLAQFSLADFTASSNIVCDTSPPTAFFQGVEIAKADLVRACKAALATPCP